MDSIENTGEVVGGSRVDVKVMLAAAGLPASEEEIAILAGEYAGQRASTDALYDVAEARYVDPALRFRADTRVADWAS
ncbi:hypothetical protein ABZV93_00230 [Actinopolymorpha sp. NPDC004070]|uniref:hypothetical protein n=1 Tax=Actinopolymorpha sp. NPDC004070 TaxID=3154548 RepID=UPI0033BC46D6